MRSTITTTRAALGKFRRRLHRERQCYACTERAIVVDRHGDAFCFMHASAYGIFDGHCKRIEP